jgi:hypothetical protein
VNWAQCWRLNILSCADKIKNNGFLLDQGLKFFLEGDIRVFYYDIQSVRKRWNILRLRIDKKFYQILAEDPGREPGVECQG